MKWRTKEQKRLSRAKRRAKRNGMERFTYLSAKGEHRMYVLIGDSWQEEER